MMEFGSDATSVRWSISEYDVIDSVIVCMYLFN